MTQRTGRCLCGAVTFNAEQVDPGYHACHCGTCRRWCGGAPFLAADATGVVFTATEQLGVLQSSEWAERGFCKQCGSPLYYRLKGADGYAIGVGAFDDASDFRLAMEIFIDRKPAGYTLAGDHPRLTEAETFAKYAPA